MTSQKLILRFDTDDDEHLCQISWNQTSSFREIVTNLTNERTNQQYCVITISPGGSKDKSANNERVWVVVHYQACSDWVSNHQ